MITSYQRDVLAKKIVKSILLDLVERRGLGRKWEALSEKEQDEIIEEWEHQASTELDVVVR